MMNFSLVILSRLKSKRNLSGNRKNRPNIWKTIFQRSQTLSASFDCNYVEANYMSDAYDYISLMYRLKATPGRNKELESDKCYIKLKELHKKERRTYKHKILELQTEIADAHRETVCVSATTCFRC